MPIAVVKLEVPFLMIRKCGVPSTTGRSALGNSSVIFTSCLPLAVISFIGAASALAAEPVAGSLWRASEKTTSSAVSGVPSWNLTSRRSLIVHTVALLSLSIASASSSCGARLASSRVRPL